MQRKIDLTRTKFIKCKITMNAFQPITRQSVNILPKHSNNEIILFATFTDLVGQWSRFFKNII